MLCLSLVRYNRGAKNHRMKSEVRYSVLVCDIIAIFGWMLQILLLIVISETWVCYIVGHLDCFFEFNPIRHGVGAHFAHGRFFCLLWEHQESWESEIFREFLKFIKVFGLQFKKKKFVFKGHWSICSHFLWYLKYGAYLINVQILPAKV